MNEGIHLDLDTWIVPGQIYIYIIIFGGLRGDHSEAATRMEAAIAETARREELPFLRA